MPTPADLLARLDAIAEGVRESGGLALLGLGSVGAGRARLDDYSDLDFFVIVAEGQKGAFMADLSWLARAQPLAYFFQNTADGYKALFTDGIFAEFAVFESAELSAIPFEAERVVWAAQGFPEAALEPRYQTPAPDPLSASDEWQIGEALSNLYVGLCRHKRGETLSALRFI